MLVALQDSRTLLDFLKQMIQLSGDELVLLWPRIEDLKWGWMLGGEDAPSDRVSKTNIEALIRLSVQLGWDELASQARRLHERYQNADLEDCVKRVLTEDLLEAFGEKLASIRLLAITKAETEFLEDAVRRLCGNSLHPDLSVPAEELNLAGRAFAVGLSTAAVSHAMRSVEASLHVLAGKTLGIIFPGSIELQDWKVLEDKIQSMIQKEQQTSRSEKRNQFLTLLSQLLLPIVGFRLAWRNHVAHAREKYETEEAHRILSHVGEFLGRLSAALADDCVPRGSETQ